MHSTAHTVQIMHIMHTAVHIVQIMRIMRSTAHTVQIMCIIKNGFQLQNLDSNYRIWILITESGFQIHKLYIQCCAYSADYAHYAQHCTYSADYAQHCTYSADYVHYAQHCIYSAIMHIMCSAAHIVRIMYIIKNRFQLQNLDSNYRIWIPSTYSVLCIQCRLCALCTALHIQCKLCTALCIQCRLCELCTALHIQCKLCAALCIQCGLCTALHI